jgi:hypothetical protein
LSFTEIAKVVGERWQVLPAEQKEACEQQANLAKEKYNTELGDYKKTSEYLQYQEYLLEFKAKYGHNRTGTVHLAETYGKMLTGRQRARGPSWKRRPQQHYQERRRNLKFQRDNKEADLFPSCQLPEIPGLVHLAQEACTPQDSGGRRHPNRLRCTLMWSTLLPGETRIPLILDPQLFPQL